MNQKMTGIPLRYKGSTREEIVWRIPLDYLIYNKYNGRIGSDVLSYEKQNGELNAELDSDREIIERFLYESKVDRNKTTMDSLLKIGQQRYGIVTSDGIIVDGNRRAMLLNRLFHKREDLGYTYHKRYHVALLSSNLAGPNDNDIEDYLNSYLPSDAEYKVRLRPIVRNIELEKIRNAQEARSVTISLNIGRPLNDFLAGQVHEEKSVQSHLKALMEFSKMTLESNTFTLTLGLGRKKKASLDIGALIDLLDSINLDANCINEIAVNYRNGSDEKIDIAKLKDSTTVLKIYFPIQGTQLGTGYILNNMDEILRNERQKYYSQVEEYFSNVAEIGEDYEINKAWEERPVV